MNHRFLPVLLLSFLGACASRPASKSPAATALAGPPPPPEHVDGAITELNRAEVANVVDAGLGRFLQDAEFEPAYVDGRYVGYRVVRIVNIERYRGVGIEPGDVITKINGASIEHEGDAFEVFRSLKTAARLEVDYLRVGQPMRISLPIVGDLPEKPESIPEVPPGNAGAGQPEKLTVSSDKPAGSSKASSDKPSSEKSSADKPGRDPARAAEKANAPKGP